MPEERVSLMEPPIEELLDKVDSKFTLVTLSARRGRQINSYFNQLGEGLGSIVPPQVSSSSRKPLTIALEEIAAGKIATKEIETTPESTDEAITSEDSVESSDDESASGTDSADGVVAAETTIIGDDAKN